MEGSTIHTAQSTSEESVKIAGSASSLFGDSTQSPFDSLFSPTNDSNTTDLNITESHPSSQTNDGSGQDYSQYYYPQQYQYDPNQQYVPSTYDSSSGYYYNPNYDPNQAYAPTDATHDPNQTYIYNDTAYTAYDPNQTYASDGAAYGSNQTYDYSYYNGTNEANNLNSAYDPNQTYASDDAAYGPNQTYDYSQYYNGTNLNSAKIDNDIPTNEHEPEKNEYFAQDGQVTDKQELELISMEFKESSSMITLNNNLAAVTSVETIETNQEHKQPSVASTEVENDIYHKSLNENREINNLEEEQEVNIVFRTNNDIFEYQPQDLEGPQKAELSQVDQPTSQIADNSQISPELEVSREPEGITDLTNKDTGKLDDLDDLVLGHTTSGTSEVHSSSTREASTVDPETNQTGTNGSNNHYQGYLADAYAQYDNNIIGTNTNNFNYPYTGHNVSQSTTDGISGIHQSTHQYPNYDSNQPTVVNTPPPQSYSPFSSNVQFVPCLYPQCPGENKPNAKFCSECGRVINESSPIVDTSKLYQDSVVQQQYGTDSMNIVNDPLGRSKGCPIVAFGFGGKVFTMFPRTVQRFTSTNQSIPITKYAPGAFIIRTLKDIIQSSDIEDFPGPLLMDNNRGGIKAKRKHVIKYLDDQIKATEDVVNSFVGEEVEKKELEASTIVLQLFKIMFEHDGVLTGSPKVEEAVRHVLAPSTTKTKPDESNFTVPADSNFDSTQSLPESSAPSSMTYSISPKAIDTLQELLLKGDRVAAINHAMNNNLWTHALIIASCVNKDLWKEVVNGFIRHELSSPLNDISQSNGRECLRVLYSLLAGNGPNSVKQFLPHSTLLNRVTQPAITTQFPPITSVSPITNAAPLNPSANLPYSPVVPLNPLYSSTTCDIPIESLEKWRETLAIILANRSQGDNQAMTALGDMLKEFGWINSAHVCYILSPQSSTQSGIDDINSRLTLVGNDCNKSSRYFCDWQTLRLTEIYELGLSLNNNDGLPFLQAYKLLYAWWLVDCGYLNEARRYCESIANIVKVYTKGSPYFHGCFLQNLKDLTQRLLEHGGNSSGNNESSSWLFAKKMPKAALDSLWDSLEVKFNKFVAGDAVDENGQKSSSISQETVGPFSHFSAITQQTSDVPSRSVSAAEFRSISDSSHEARRSTTPNARLQKQINGHQRRSSTPGVGVQTAEYMNGGYNYNEFSPAASDGQISMSPMPEDKSSYITPAIDDSIVHFGTFGVQGTGNKEQHKVAGYSYNNSNYNMYQPSQQNDNSLQSSSENGQSYGSTPYGQQSTQVEHNYSSWSGNSEVDANKQQTTYPYYQPTGNSDTSYTNDSAWWNNSSPYTNDDGSKQDQITTNNYEEGEFVSPMDNSNLSFVPTSAPITSAGRNSEWDNIDDDLGLGNNTFNAKKKEKQTDDDNHESTENVTQESEQPKEEKKEEKSGWFGRWFSKKEGGGKAANLGEESSFYFDPVQKRWVNKKGGTDTPTTSTPPPPPKPMRAKTTSPTPSAPMMNSNSNMQSTPPPNPYRQSLPPLNATGGTVSTPPVKQRSASSASTRRPIRSRYVDVMNQPPPSPK